jgi:stalled ribosome alternative rescue factor ArfA
MNEEQAHIFESLLSSLADANQKSVELYVLREPPKPAIASQRYQQEHLQYRLKRSTLAAECEDSKRQVSRALKLLIERGLRVIIKDQNGEVKNNDIGAVVDDPIFKIEVEKQNS